ncbi:MAG: O-antigen ligase family protein [Clostridia bacterium]|nr:O-antigen ligase family protein [Clostridia bacterium]
MEKTLRTEPREHESADSFKPRPLIICGTALSLFHVVLFQALYFVDLNVLRTVELLFFIVFFVYAVIYGFKHRKQLSFKAEYVILAALTAWFFVSCAVMTYTRRENWFELNKEYLVDATITLLVFFPVGRYYARAGCPKALKNVVHVLILLRTVFIAYALFIIFRGGAVDLPNGGQIKMDEDFELQLNYNSNTAGAWQLVFFLCCFIMIFVIRHPAMKAAYSIAAAVNYTALALSNSRTAYIAALFGLASTVFVWVYQKKTAVLPKKKAVFIAAVFAILSCAVFLLLRDQVFYLYHASVGRFTSPVIADDSLGIKRILTAESGFTGRTTIWKHALNGIFSSLQVFLTGVTPAGVVGLIMRMSGGKVNYYTHNQLLEIAVSLGVPAMCVCVIWILHVLRQALNLIRNNYTQILYPLIIVLSLLLANMTEATLLFYFNVAGHVFFLLCGWICGKAYGKKTRS